MRIFAEKAHHRIEKIDCETDDNIPFRVPILIRIGEFAMWLENHGTKTLIDYIGKQTWFSERYCDEDNENVINLIINKSRRLTIMKYQFYVSKYLFLRDSRPTLN
jgi:hypothetical protein